MTLETIFVTQMASILGFIVALFVLYKVLVAAKDATIETLKQQINLQEQKLSELESQEPDILIQVLQRRTEALEKELKEREELKDQSPEEASKSLERVKIIEKELQASELVLEKGIKITRRARQATAATRQFLLKLYDGSCQACGVENNSIMELAHIKSFHSGGESSVSNMLLLCPNDHRLFDKGSWGINDDMNFIRRIGKLRISQGHNVSKDSLKWHREQVLIDNKE
jgi:predicted restriction endonuclease